MLHARFTSGGPSCGVPPCGRETPDALLECKHCGASTRPSLLRRVMNVFHRSPAPAEAAPQPMDWTEPEQGIEMSADGAKAISFSVSMVTTTRTASGPLESLPADLRAKAQAVIDAGGGQVSYERTTSDGATSEQIVFESGDGTRQVYQSMDEVPAEIRKLLGRFADSPINRDAPGD